MLDLGRPGSIAILPFKPRLISFLVRLRKDVLRGQIVLLNNRTSPLDRVALNRADLHIDFVALFFEVANEGMAERILVAEIIEMGSLRT